MDIKLLKHTARNSFALMLVVIVISIVISKDNQSMIYANSTDNQSMISDDQNVNIQNLNEDNEKSQNINNIEIINDETTFTNITDIQLGDKYLIIKKLNKSTDNVTIQDLYMSRSIRITITGLEEEIFNDESLVRINRGKEYSGIPEMELEGLLQTSSIGLIKGGNKATERPIIITEVGADSDPVKEFNIQYSKNVITNLYTARMDICLDQIYGYILYQDEENIYIDLRRPKDVYDKIVVIDPGHGGADGGAYSKNEEYFEKDINLDIALYLKELLDKKDLKVYYTRTSDQTVYLNPRVYLANEVEADFFLSIHCNANESSQPYGCEVLYNERMLKDGIKPEEFANICLEELKNVIHRVNRGLVNGNEMIIIQKAEMPTALVEIAFMSNEEDMNFLRDEENKKNIAIALEKVIERAYAELQP